MSGGFRRVGLPIVYDGSGLYETLVSIGHKIQPRSVALGRFQSLDVAAQGVVLREIGLSLTEDPRILTRFQQDTGITMEGNSQILGNQITFWLQNFKDYDVNQVNFSQNAPLLAQNAIQPFAVADIPAWNDQVLPLFRESGSPGSRSVARKACCCWLQKP